MMAQSIDEQIWKEVPISDRLLTDVSGPTTTYWTFVWTNLKKNAFALAGLIMTFFLLIFSFIGPYLSKHDYSTQNLTHANIPPRFDIYKVSDDMFVFVHGDYRLYEVSENGEVFDRLDPIVDSPSERLRIYDVNGGILKLDFSYAALGTEANPDGVKFKLDMEDQTLERHGRVMNKTHLMGTDSLGRDFMTRMMQGGRISLSIAFIATIVNFIIGVLYGGVSGYFGGSVDRVLMRFVDLISAIPLVLYVILLSVIIGSGYSAIIIAIGSVYWINMARIVRAQVIRLKGEMFVKASKALGASPSRIIFKHLIPNATGQIVVTMTMMVPGAIFTEAFLSFVGLGINAPSASWGTLASDALGGLGIYPFQLLIPSVAITLTILAIHYLGDGLRDALDPKLRV